MDAIELLWEVNDLPPYDGRRLRSSTAAFAVSGQKEFLKDKSFEILAGLDEKTFTKIASIQGPANRYLHKGVTTGWLYYYKVRALDKSGKLIAESPVTMGAAGSNLIREPGHEEMSLGIRKESREAGEGNGTYHPPQAFSVVEGARPYSKGKQILQFDPAWASSGTTEIMFIGSLIPMSPEKIYLQGGWVRAPGNVWYGRNFYDKDKQKICLGYSMPAITQTPEWTYVVQLLLPDVDGSGFRRPEGRSMAVKQWMFPTDGRFMKLLVVAFGPGECDDHWMLEVTKAPEGASVIPSQ